MSESRLRIVIDAITSGVKGELGAIVTDLKGVQTAAAGTSKGLGGLEKGAKGAAGGMKGLSGGLNDTVKGLTGFDLATIGTTAVVAGLAAGLKYSIAQAAESETIMAQTEAVIKSTGQAAGLTATQIGDLAVAESHLSTFSDEAIQKGQNLLLTFTNIGHDVFPAATRSMVDMAVAMHTDASSGAIQLGKALNDPVAGITALTRVGVSFTAEQKKMIAAMVEAGDVAGAQKIILAELNKEFGGSALADLKTYAGQMKLLKNNTDNIAESIGKRLLPGLTQAATALNDSITIQDEYNAALDAGALSVTDVVKIRLADMFGLRAWGLETLRAAEEQVKLNAAIDAHAEALNADVPQVLAATSAYSGMVAASIANEDASNRYAAAVGEAAAKTAWLADRTRAAADANDAMLKSHQTWLDGVAGDLVSALDAAGIKGEAYAAALQAIDDVYGTSKTNDAAFQAHLEAINAEFAKTGDVVAYEIALKGLADGGASEAAAKAEDAANAVSLLNDSIYNLPTDKHITITTDFIENHPGGGANNTTGIGGGAARGADFIVPPGFPNDSFPLRVQTGEHVQVTPAGQAGDSAGRGDTIYINDRLAAALYLETRRRASLGRHEGLM